MAGWRWSRCRCRCRFGFGAAAAGTVAARRRAAATQSTTGDRAMARPAGRWRAEVVKGEGDTEEDSVEWQGALWGRSSGSEGGRCSRTSATRSAPRPHPEPGLGLRRGRVRDAAASVLPGCLAITRAVGHQPPGFKELILDPLLPATNSSSLSLVPRPGPVGSLALPSSMTGRVSTSRS